MKTAEKWQEASAGTAVSVAERQKGTLFPQEEFDEQQNPDLPA